MIIVDSQIHVWSPNTPDRSWPAGREVFAQGPSMSAETVLRAMDEAGVARAVLVPPSWIGDDNSDAIDAARDHPDRFRVMGRFDLQGPRGPERVAHWRQQPGMLGIRLTFHLPPWRDWLTDGSLTWFWRAAETAGLPVMLYVPGLVPAAGAIAARHPGLRLILDHLARPGRLKDDAAFADLDEVLALARHPNVAVKVSALPCYTTETYPFTGLHRHVRRVYDAFGPQRMLWGTDYTRLPVPYRDAVRLFTEALDFLGEDDRRWIMGRAAAEWLDWPIS